MKINQMLLFISQKYILLPLFKPGTWRKIKWLMEKKLPNNVSFLYSYSYKYIYEGWLLHYLHVGEINFCIPQAEGVD